VAEYQRIEYRIGKDGKIVETVIDGNGTSCTTATQGIEQALGAIEHRELLPSYSMDESYLEIDNIQSTQS